MADLTGAVGELHMTVEITRQDTGKVEKVEMVGYASEDQLKQLLEQGNEQKQEG
jgi:ribonuclease PH